MSTQGRLVEQKYQEINRNYILYISKKRSFTRAHEIILT